MCNFFSFISDGQGNVKYFNVEQRKQFSKSNPKQYEMDSHSSIAEFYYGNSNSDDKCNKFEYSNGHFEIDQINIKDDSKQVKKWIEKFSKTKEFEQICKISVKQKGYNLQFVPVELRTEKLCLEAVKQKGYNLQFVPEKLKTEKLCKIAVKQVDFVLQYVPKKYQHIFIK